MRLPWVARAAFDLSQHNNAQLHLLVKEHADVRYDNLLAKYHSLRMAGANPVAESHPIEPAEPDPVQWAINQRAGSNHALRMYLTVWAAKERLGGADTATITERIEKWSTDGDED